jgi:hypothetical protein
LRSSSSSDSYSGSSSRSSSSSRSRSESDEEEPLGHEEETPHSGADMIPWPQHPCRNLDPGVITAQERLIGAIYRRHQTAYLEDHGREGHNIYEELREAWNIAAQCTPEEEPRLIGVEETTSQ